MTAPTTDFLARSRSARLAPRPHGRRFVLDRRVACAGLRSVGGFVVATTVVVAAVGAVVHLAPIVEEASVVAVERCAALVRDLARGILAALCAPAGPF